MGTLVAHAGGLHELLLMVSAVVLFWAGVSIRGYIRKRRADRYDRDQHEVGRS